MRITWEKTLLSLAGLTLLGGIWGVSYASTSDGLTDPAGRIADIAPAHVAPTAPIAIIAAFYDGDGDEGGDEDDGPVTAKITAQQAADAALKAQPGAVTEVELERENGKAVYEVHITASDGKQFKVNVDGDTGQVLVVIGNGGSVPAKITFQQASDSALKVRPGTVTKVELENENGKAVYEIHITGTDGKRYDVKVDGDTAAVLLVQLDNED
jgi:uncharacterized membrane protein YkoI